MEFISYQKISMKKVFSIAALLCLLGGCAYAQNDTVMDLLLRVTSPEVNIVSEKRLDGIGFSQAARNVSVITAEMIKQMPVTTVQEALQYVSGVDLRQRGPLGAQADLTIMGSTFEQVLILVNGIPMRDPQTGHNQMNLPVSLNQIAQIEILMGSASRIYGANAMAGAINIVTKKPGEELIYVQAFAGSNFQNDTATGKQYYMTGGQASLGIRAKKSGHQLDVSFIETNGYRYNSDNSQQRLNYTGRFQLGKGNLHLFGGTVFNTFGSNNFYAAPNDKNAQESVNTSYGGARFQVNIGRWSIRPLIYARYNHDDYIYIEQKPEVYRNNHYTTASGAELHVKQINRLGALGLGLESRMEMINSNNLGKHERYYYAAYAEQRFDFGERVQLTAGANTQYNTDYGWRFYPGGELNVMMNSGLSAYTNAGVSNRLPTYTDLYYIGPSNIGNEALQPERALNIEGGVKWKHQGLRAQASLFARESYDFIDFTRAADTLSWQPQNFATVSVAGIDLRGQYIFKPTERFFEVQSLYAGFTYLTANFSANEMQSKYALEHLTAQFTGRITLKTSFKFSHTISARYAERFSGADYAVLDYRLRFNHPNFGAFIDITNILDRKYIESGIIEMPGRWFRIGVEFKILHRQKMGN